MKSSKVFPLCVLLLMTVGHLHGQNSLAGEKKNRFLFITEIGYLQGTGTVTIDNINHSNDGIGARIRFIAGRFLNEHFSAGLGFGLDGFHEPSYSTFPIFIQAKGYLKDANNTPFAYLDLGYALEISDNFENGPLTNLGIGYRLFLGIFGRKVHFLPNMGFNLQKIRRNQLVVAAGQLPPQLENTTEKFSVKSFTLNLGVEF